MKRTGIDIGNLYLKAVKIEDNRIKEKLMVFHQKEVVPILKEFLNDEDSYVGFTGSFIKEYPQNFPYFDEVKSLISSVKKLYPSVKYIFDIGANSSKIIEIDEKGNLKNIYKNYLCAAGTGTFFDQQIKRLSLSYEEIENWDIPINNVPPIASRCTVFAKTDLINRQQEGYSKREIWAGLCKSLSKGILNSLLKGKKIDGKLILAGGLSKNKFFVNYLKEELKDFLVESELSPFLGAIGAAFLSDVKFSKDLILHLENSLKEKKQTKIVRAPQLSLLKSKPVEKIKSYEEEIDGVEVRIYDVKENDELNVYFGIDIGSTSTKCVLMDENYRILIDLYTRTKGEPIKATKKILETIQKIKDRFNLKINVIGCGTTGSGRKIVGEFLGADVIVNEITAHAKGALKVYEDAEVIFEIGGQDSKYIRLKNGKVYECNMNYICSAGTGSFIEEEANKLGFNVKELGDVLKDISPPQIGERCTVFMDQDIEKLLSLGFSKEEVMGACIYSVVYNYLNKVVGKKYIPEGKIIFQGATARNKALVAAFERVCNREIVVSPYAHIMGAYGTAIILKEELKGKTKFKGFEVKDEEEKIWYENCNLCENKCKITYLKSKDEVVSFGYQCGREPDDNRKREREEITLFNFYKTEVFKLSQSKNNLKVYIPRILSSYTLFPLYKTFLENLGYRVLVSKYPDRESIEKGKKLSSAEFCLPVKVAFGLISELVDKKDALIFLPWVINYPSKDKGYNYFCPYVEASAGYILSTLKYKGVEEEKFLTPVFDFLFPQNLFKYFEKLDINKNKVKKAFEEGIKAQRAFEEKIKEEREKILKEIEDKDKKFIVLFGRPYIIYCDSLNLLIPLKFANFGLKVIPWNFLVRGESEISIKNMYWFYGKRVIEVAEFIKDKENLFPVYLSCFSCGPDSFLLSYLEEIFKDKPFLILELDEHGGEAVFQTRLEAFYDVIREYKPSKKTFYISRETEKKDIYSRTIWIPSMHPEGARLFAASFRRFGLDAKALPLSNEEHLNTGKKFLRGSECLPCALTLGTFICEVKKEENGKHTLFMPTSSGPCRFGQYANLHKIIFEREKMNVEILSPNSYNAYEGLPKELRKFLWTTILIFDSLLKARNRIRPYEKNKGKTDRVYFDSVDKMEKIIESGKDPYLGLEECFNNFSKIERENVKKPLVGVVGEIYVRLDPFSNDDVIRAIERCSCEAWLSPVSEWIWYTDFTARWRAKNNGNLKEYLITLLKNRFFRGVEEKIYEITKNVIGDRKEPEIEEIMKKVEGVIPWNFGTEAPLTIGRAIIFKEQGAKAVVNVSPFTCMPGNISQAFSHYVSSIINIPFINIFYDGQKGSNEDLEIFLRNLVTSE
ncbi:MAG: acyl-CoA dehydratase activase [Candidatus Hydrothermales bacterium]